MGSVTMGPGTLASLSIECKLTVESRTVEHFGTSVYRMDAVDWYAGVALRYPFTTVAPASGRTPEAVTVG